MKKIQIKACPTKIQYNIINSPKRFKIVRAGRRFGKTWLALYTAMKFAISNPNVKVWYLANELKHCREQAIPLLFQMLPQELIHKYSSQDLTITLKNGSIIASKTTENLNSLRGRSLDLVILEEFAFCGHAEEIWYKIIRPSLADTKGKAIFISSPNGNNTFKKIEKNAETLPDWGIWHYTIYDNPAIEREEIESIRQSTPPDAWKQEYLAEYVENIGQVYFEFDYSKHTYTEKPVHKALIRGMDWGIEDNTTCSFVYLGVDGKIYVDDEYIINNTPIPTIAKGIKNLTINTPRATVIDSSAFKRESDFSSVTDRFRQCGIYTTPATKDKEATISAVKELFESGNILISTKCIQTIQAIADWQYDSHEPDILAAMRYAIAYIIYNGGIKLPTIKKANKKQTLQDILNEENRNINLQKRLNTSLKQFTVYKSFHW